MKKGWLFEKVIVIIGGTTGLGLDAALRCIEEDAKVVVVGRDPEHTKQASELLGPKGWAISADATDIGTAEMAISTAIEHFGSFTGLYHVAGGSGRRFGDGPVHDITEEGWMKTLHWNLDSVMYSNRAAVKYFLKEKKPGVILNMSSVLGFSPSPKYFGTHAYAAAKSAVIGFSKSLAAYYAPHDIRVNVIAPGLVETPMSQRAFGDQHIMKFISSKQPLNNG
ncbi:MAG TPA: SDR family oxidoreductase, partial [Chitinophagaceae bacterium]|nr:SDR family oxidoreductase [Chitinophagaceae bacterium]